MQETFSFGRICVICKGETLSTCSPSQRTGFGILEPIHMPRGQVYPLKLNHKGRPQGKLSSQTSHVGKFQRQMKKPASKNNVEEKSRKILDIPQTSTSMHVHIHKHHYKCAHKHTDTHTHMYTHIYIHSQHMHVGKR